MNKHTLIVIVASIVIAGTILYSFFGVNGINDIQMRWYQKGFDYTTMITGGKIELCNPTQTPININHIEMNLLYQNNEFGKITSDGMVLFPSKSGYIEAKNQFSSSDDSLSMNLDMSSPDSIMKLNSDQIQVIVNYETRFLGFIPYSVTKNYDGIEFEKIMNQVNNEFAC